MLSVRCVFLASLLVAFVHTPSTALADDPDPRAEPDLRFDALFPFAGLGGFFAPVADYSRGIFVAGFEARWAHSSGNGGMVRGTWGTTVWGSGYGADIAYLHRVRLAGDRHLGLAVDSMIGPTFAALEHNESDLALGPHIGGHVSFSLDFRVRSFIAALGVQYRMLVPTRDSIDGGPTGPEHVLTATLGVGISVY